MVCSTDLLEPKKRIYMNFPVLLSGYYGKENFGDDLLLRALSDSLKAEDSEIRLTVDLPKSSYVFQQSSVEPLFVGNREPHHFVMGGGTQLHYFWPTLNDLSRLAKPFFKRPTIDPMYVSQHAVGIGVGPFSGNVLKERRTKKLLSTFTTVGIRDSVSEAWCEQNKVRCEKFPDLAYGLSNEFLEQNRSKDHAKPKVGLVLRQWNNLNSGRNHVSRARMVLKNLAREYDVTLFCFDSSERPDLFVDTEFLSDAVVWNPNEIGFSSMLSRMGEMDVIVSSRFHGIIAANILCLPSISINIEQKLSAVRDGSEGICGIWNPPFLEKELFLGIESALQNRIPVRTRLSELLEYRRKVLSCCWQRLVASMSAVESMR